MEKKDTKKKIEIITSTSPLDAGVCGPDGCVINWDKAENTKEGKNNGN